MNPGYRIKYFRKMLNIKQEEVANAIKVKQTFLSRVERGESVLNFHQLADLIKTYNVSINWLLTGSGTMFAVNEENNEIDNNDIDLLTEIIYLSEKACVELNAKIDPMKKAEQIVNLFLHYKKEEQNADKKQIDVMLKLA